MLVSDDYVIEEIDIDERAVYDDRDGVILFFKQTDDSVIRDGIDGVAVTNEDNDTYRVDYWGYLYGRMRITREGLTELAENLLEEQGDLGYWVVDSKSVDINCLPSWIPESAPVE